MSNNTSQSTHYMHSCGYLALDFFSFVRLASGLLHSAARSKLTETVGSLTE